MQGIYWSGENLFKINLSRKIPILSYYQLPFRGDIPLVIISPVKTSQDPPQNHRFTRPCISALVIQAQHKTKNYSVTNIAIEIMVTPKIPHFQYGNASSTVQFPVIPCNHHLAFLMKFGSLLTTDYKIKWTKGGHFWLHELPNLQRWGCEFGATEVAITWDLRAFVHIGHLYIPRICRIVKCHHYVTVTKYIDSCKMLSITSENTSYRYYYT